MSCGRFVKFAYKRQRATQNLWTKGSEGNGGSDQILMEVLYAAVLCCFAGCFIFISSRNGCTLLLDID